VGPRLSFKPAVFLRVVDRKRVCGTAVRRTAKELGELFFFAHRWVRYLIFTAADTGKDITAYQVFVSGCKVRKKRVETQQCTAVQSDARTTIFTNDLKLIFLCVKNDLVAHKFRNLL
jgi:hypothetical protein